MSTFILVYRAPTDYVPYRTEAQGAWQRYFEALGPNLIDAGQSGVRPEHPRRRQLGHGPRRLLPDRRSDLAAATVVAEGCPFLAEGGGVEIGELTLLKPATTATAQDQTHTSGLATAPDAQTDHPSRHRLPAQAAVLLATSMRYGHHGDEI